MAEKLKSVILSLFALLMVLLFTFLLSRVIFPRRYAPIMEKYCMEYDTDISLVSALIKTESNFDSDAVSHADAKGIMQLTEDTFDFCNAWLKVGDADIFNPEDNIRAGVWYLSYLLKRYDYDITNAVAAYNAGASNVDKWLKDLRYSDGKKLSRIPFEETRNHVNKIKCYTHIYDFLY